MSAFMLSDLPTDPAAPGNIASFPVVPPRTPEPQDITRTRYRTIWISDVHLGTRGCNTELLIDFLDHTDSETM